MIRLVILMAISFVLTSCATSSTDVLQADSPRREAAKVNASLGQEYMSRGQMEVALEKLKKAVALDDSYAPGQTLLALLYEQIGEPELAERHYEFAVEAAPDNGAVNNNFGVFLCQQGRPSEAEKHFLNALNDPFYGTPAVAYANAGSCMLQSGHLDKAERYLRQSLEYDAEFADSLLSLAELSVERSDDLRARAFLQRYESTGSDSAESLLLGFEVETRLGDTQAARSYRDRLLNNHADSEQAKIVRDNR